MVRYVCHGRNNSVSPTGTSNTTPQEMVYRERVCMGDYSDIMGIGGEEGEGEGDS